MYVSLLFGLKTPWEKPCVGIFQTTENILGPGFGRSVTLTEICVANEYRPLLSSRAQQSGQQHQKHHVHCYPLKPPLRVGVTWETMEECYMTSSGIIFLP